MNKYRWMIRWQNHHSVVPLTGSPLSASPADDEASCLGAGQQGGGLRSPWAAEDKRSKHPLHRRLVHTLLSAGVYRSWSETSRLLSALLYDYRQRHRFDHCSCILYWWYTVYTDDNTTYLWCEGANCWTKKSVSQLQVSTVLSLWWTRRWKMRYSNLVVPLKVLPSSWTFWMTNTCSDIWVFTHVNQNQMCLNLLGLDQFCWCLIGVFMLCFLKFIILIFHYTKVMRVLDNFYS